MDAMEEAAQGRWRSLLATFRSNYDLKHGWDVELQCPKCGAVAVPEFTGWTPTHAIGLGDKPVIYANLKCTRCSRDLRLAAGEKLVELFSKISIPRQNKRLIVTLIAYTLVIVSGMIASEFMFPGWQRWTWLLLAPLIALIHPLAMWFNHRIASIRKQCECGAPDYQFMGMLGRSYCHRCSSCGKLLRLRD
jgi:hypothetical protein